MKVLLTLLPFDAYIEFMETELSYCELRRREVINGSDGSRLGHIIDLIFSVESGKIRGVILPYGKRGIFQKSQDLFIPWTCIQKIGEDVILVEINDLPSCSPTCAPAKRPERLPAEPPPHKKHKDKDDCDGKCEKCMLFDCARRWDTVGAAE